MDALPVGANRNLPA